MIDKTYSHFSTDSFTGGSADFAHGVAGIRYSYLIELRDTGVYGFLLPVEEAIPTAEEAWAGVKVVVKETIAHAQQRSLADADPVAYTDPVVNADSGTNADPGTNPGPGTNTDPGTNADPGAMDPVAAVEDNASPSMSADIPASAISDQSLSDLVSDLSDLEMEDLYESSDSDDSVGGSVLPAGNAFNNDNSVRLEEGQINAAPVSHHASAAPDCTALLGHILLPVLTAIWRLWR